MSALGQKQTYAVQKAMSASTPIATAKADFRKRSCLLYPKSGHVRCTSRCLLWAKSGHQNDHKRPVDEAISSYHSGVRPHSRCYLCALMNGNAETKTPALGRGATEQCQRSQSSHEASDEPPAPSRRLRMPATALTCQSTPKKNSGSVAGVSRAFVR